MGREKDIDSCGRQELHMKPLAGAEERKRQTYGPNERRGENTKPRGWLLKGIS